MNTSRAPRPRARRAAVIRVLAALAILLLAAAAEGCARSSAEPPARRPPEASAPEAPRSAARQETTRPAASAEVPAARPPVLDPGEEITPGELESIPEPVPASPGGAGGSNPRSAAKTALAASQTDSAAAGKRITAGMTLWSVQIFATQDRELADRTAGEASRLLGVKARVEYERSSYKVRLGDYGSEEEARSLRDLAVRSGYPGAFRIRCSPTTLNKG